ncbi:uncharacterized protein V6R79_016971 [Siganus canaliculatus]
MKPQAVGSLHTFCSCLVQLSRGRSLWRIQTKLVKTTQHEIRTGEKYEARRTQSHPRNQEVESSRALLILVCTFITSPATFLLLHLLLPATTLQRRIRRRQRSPLETSDNDVSKARFTDVSSIIRPYRTFDLLPHDCVYVIQFTLQATRRYACTCRSGVTFSLLRIIILAPKTRPNPSVALCVVQCQEQQESLKSNWFTLVILFWDQLLLFPVQSSPPWHRWPLKNDVYQVIKQHPESEKVHKAALMFLCSVCSVDPSLLSFKRFFH